MDFRRIRQVCEYGWKDAVILSQFLLQLYRVGDPLAGGACELVFRVVVADIVLQYGRHNDTFVHAVVCHGHDHIAEVIAEVLLFQCGICKCKAERYASVVESLDDAFHEVLVNNASLSSSAVPY